MPPIHLFLPLALLILLPAVPAMSAEATASAPPPELPAHVDLRPRFVQWGLMTRPQGSRGTCSVFAVTGAVEYAAAARRGRGTAFSVEFLNWAAHQATGRKVDGGFFSDIWSGFQSYGICPEAALPYRSAFDPDLHPDGTVLAEAKEAQGLHLALHWIKEWNVRTGLSSEQLTRVKQTLAGGWPVCGGFRWPRRPRWTEGILQMCGPRAVFDGHSVLLVGYREDPAQPGGGVFLIRNSGEGGRDGALPYAYVQAYMNDAAWVEAPR